MLKLNIIQLDKFTSRFNGELNYQFKIITNMILDQNINTLSLTKQRTFKNNFNVVYLDVFDVVNVFIIHIEHDMMSFQ